MDSQDQKRDAVSKLILIYRKTTRLVKLLPFVYLVIFSLYLVLSLFCSERVVCFIESLALVSPSATAVLLLISKIFSLCRWHRIACIIPMLSQAEGVIDNYIVTFTQVEVIAMNSITVAMCSLFLVQAYKHFFYGRKAVS